MIKKFSLIAMVAALLVACSSETPESMEKAQQPETTTPEPAVTEATEAETEVVVAPETIEGEEAVTPETEVPAEGTEATKTPESH